MLAGGSSVKTIAILVTVTFLTRHNTMSTGRTSPDKCGLYTVFSCLRVPQLVCIISAFFLALNKGIRWGDISNRIMFSWCFCIIGTLTIVILELYRFPTDFPFCWYKLLHHLCLLCCPHLSLGRHLLPHHLHQVLALRCQPKPGHCRHCVLLHRMCGLSWKWPAYGNATS